MKKVFVLLVACAMAMPLLNSCKKGENDPGISLKSRKARLTAEWTLKEGTETETSGTTTVTTYTGTSVSYGSGTASPYSETLTYNTDGTFEWKMVSGLNSNTYEGSWFFGSKIKELDLKNKESVIMVCTKSTSVSGGVTNQATYDGANAQIFTFIIDELKSKELILKLDGTTTSGTVSTTTGTKTYEAK
ncbi:MAG: hypothetical protein WCK02_05140 [Bacteroidota bacterium]